MRLVTSQRSALRQRRITEWHKPSVKQVLTILILPSYLDGQKFNELTDHNMPKWILNLVDEVIESVRLQAQMSEFELKIVRKAGISNRTSDAL